MGGPGSGRRPGSKSETFITRANDPANVSADSNARVMALACELMAFPEVDYSSPEAVQGRFVEYLALCSKHGIRPQVQGAAMALHMDRHAFSGIGRGDSRYYKYKGTMTPETVKVLQRCYQMLGVCYESYLTEERGNPVKWLFLGKNYFDMRDQCEVVTYSPPDERPRQTPEEVAAKYAAMVGRPRDGYMLEGENS